MRLPAVSRRSCPERLGRIFFPFVGMYLNRSRDAADGMAVQNVFCVSTSVSCE
jgi:hypothetical protein